MDQRIAAAVQDRLRQNRPEILRSIEAARAGNPLAAENNAERRRERLQTKAGLTVREADALSRAIGGGEKVVHAAAPDERSMTEAATQGPPFRVAARPELAEKVWGDTTDFVNVSFLDKGARIARAVGRVAYRNGQALGSGFLIGNGLFLTNNHVVPTREAASFLAVEFDYELDLTGNPKPVTSFAIDTTVFMTDTSEAHGLDFTVFALGERLTGELPLEVFGWSGLSDSADKHMLGEFVNIVQHPNGRHKEVVLRENRLVGRYADALHYVADTEPGSSGSPVFNSEWRPIALHHWGGPWRQVFGDDQNPLDIEVNEGIRISAIVRNMRNRLVDLDAHARERIARALDMGGEPERAGDNFVPDHRTLAGLTSGTAPSARMDDSGGVTWTVPVEISVRLPTLSPELPAAKAGPAAATSAGAGDPERRAIGLYADRQGYKSRFIEGFDVPLPALAADLVPLAARSKAAGPGDNPFELKYHHFSIVMNGRRRLAFFTACNIDGATAKALDRQSGTMKPLRPDSPGLNDSLEEAATEAASWRGEPRLEPHEFAGNQFYAGQRVAGFPNSNDPGRLARMFQRGHLIRRLDPVWGEDEQARAAEADTFHFTNAAPQVGFFNQGTAAPRTPGSGGGKLWRAVENYVLRNAVAENQRVTTFTGPIFSPDDRPFRGLQVPTRFFKIVVWAEGSELRSLAMLASQAEVIETWPEAMFGGAGESTPVIEGPEAFMEPGELDRVTDFLSTIARVEQLTGLDFGDAARAADVRSGEQDAQVASEDQLVLRPGPAPRRTPRRPSRRKQP
ncbi:DNA/RNA non-specific endonuclease [Croceibacterium ferulae]|uniref:DNA/RNA non-specific endonuclease n=1 Tax=Croceibacterium ferulae TaxID=1854641 RepID=UPI000EB006A8|nr:DNA/RNA non-specific endonuclease [Croceibacterium ferulae]